MRIEGTMVPQWFLQTNTQPEIGPEAYDAGAKFLTKFFHEEIKKFLVPDLDKLGRAIIDCCLSGGDVHSYEQFMGKADV
jgi:hypothetical protein